MEDHNIFYIYWDYFPCSAYKTSTSYHIIHGPLPHADLPQPVGVRVTQADAEGGRLGYLWGFLVFS